MAKKKKAKRRARHPGGGRYTPPAPRLVWYEGALAMLEASAAHFCSVCAAADDEEDECGLEACPGTLAEFPDGTLECSEGDRCLGFDADHAAGVWLPERP